MNIRMKFKIRNCFKYKRLKHEYFELLNKFEDMSDETCAGEYQRWIIKNNISDDWLALIQRDFFEWANDNNRYLQI